MKNGKFISFDEMLYYIRRHPLLEDALKSDLAMDTYDVLRRIGAPGIYADERIVVNISNYTGDIPDNILYINEVNFLANQSDEVPMQYVIGNKKSKWHCAAARDLKIRSMYGYSINPGKIHTDFEEGQVIFYYKAIQRDDEGYPMIPDDVSVKDAVVAYVKVKHFGIKVDLGILPQHTLQRAEQDYAWYMGQAEGKFKLPNPDEYNAIARSMLRIIRDLNYKE